MIDDWHPVSHLPDIKESEYGWLSSDPVLAVTKAKDLVVVTCERMAHGAPEQWYTCCSERWDITHSVAYWRPLPPIPAELLKED